MKTLEDVVKHYNSGGKNNKQKNNLVKPLNLTTIEQQNLIAFLKTLTDKKFCTNKYFN
jgi:cytochrome c peroxidase